jgi:polysaccharide export outer membrane protein
MEFHPLTLIALTPLASVLLSSCSLSGVDGFDPYETSGLVAPRDKLHFEKVGTTGQITPEDLKPMKQAFQIGAGDLLEIEIVEVPFTKAVTSVMPDGMLYYDAADGIYAVGKTVEQLEDQLASELKKTGRYTFPIVNINLKKIESRTYTILGQIKKPGVYGMTRPTTILEAISSAGGTYTSFLGGKTIDLADLKRSILVRDKKIIPVDFEALIQEGDLKNNDVYLKAGDYIYLPAAGTQKVYVLGAVKFPTAVGYSSRLNFASALASANGPAANAYLAGALLIRGSASNPLVAKVNLRQVMQGKSLNFDLEPGDILWVPKAPWQKLKEYALVAADTAITTVAVRETARMFEDDVKKDTAATATEQVIEQTISTGPEEVQAPAPAPIVVDDSVIETIEVPTETAPLTETSLSTAFGGR